MRYDYRDQMVEYEETFGNGAFVRFQYDALGRRVSRLSLDSATYYVQGGQSAWQVLAEYDGPSSTASLKADYVYGNYIDEPIQMRRDYDGSGPGALQTFYYHQDDLFNVVALTAGPGGVSVPSLGTRPAGAVVERYRYGDYGLPAFFNDTGTSTYESARTGNPYLFTGREWDTQTRLYHYRTRYMEPTWGRFTTRDTIGIWGDLANRGNGYEYVGGGPGMYLDPFGEKKVRRKTPEEKKRDRERRIKDEQRRERWEKKQREKFNQPPEERPSRLRELWDYTEGPRRVFGTKSRVVCAVECRTALDDCLGGSNDQLADCLDNIFAPKPCGGPPPRGMDLQLAIESCDTNDGSGNCIGDYIGCGLKCLIPRSITFGFEMIKKGFDFIEDLSPF